VVSNNKNKRLPVVVVVVVVEITILTKGIKFLGKMWDYQLLMKVSFRWSG
jgi:hypothetical protein